MKYYNIQDPNVQQDIRKRFISSSLEGSTVVLIRKDGDTPYKINAASPTSAEKLYNTIDKIIKEQKLLNE